MPARISAQAIPSSSALWASIGPSIRSPIAEIGRDIGPEMSVHRHFAGLGIDRYTDLGKPQALRVRSPADRDQYPTRNRSSSFFPSFFSAWTVARSPSIDAPVTLVSR